MAPGPRRDPQRPPDRARGFAPPAPGGHGRPARRPADGRHRLRGRASWNGSWPSRRWSAPTSRPSARWSRRPSPPAPRSSQALAEVRHLAEAAKEAAADLMSGVAGPPVPPPDRRRAFRPLPGRGAPGGGGVRRRRRAWRKKQRTRCSSRPRRHRSPSAASGSCPAATASATAGRRAWRDGPGRPRARHRAIGPGQAAGLGLTAGGIELGLNLRGDVPPAGLDLLERQHPEAHGGVPGILNDLRHHVLRVLPGRRSAAHRVQSV